jgi:hypothetical protein
MSNIVLPIITKGVDVIGGPHIYPPATDWQIVNPWVWIGLGCFCVIVIIAAIIIAVILIKRNNGANKKK